MNVEVIVPWRPGCEHRERAWTYLSSRYRAEHPAWKVSAALCPPGPWCKARTVTPALRAATADVIVVADADVWCPDLRASVQAVADGAPWAIPHTIVHRLTRDATLKLITTGAGLEDLETGERPYRGVQGGGIVIATRDTLLEIPLDPRYTGWGQEDTSWAIALHTLAGAAWRGPAPLIHLWHPPQERYSRKIGTLAGHRLHRRYLAARRDPDQMRALIKEASP